MKTPASERILMRFDDIQASLGAVMVDIKQLEEAVRTIMDVGQEHSDAIKLHGNLIQDLTNRIEALERSDG